MLTRATVRGDFLHICIGCTDATGEAVDPTTAEAHFFKVSQVNGNLSYDSDIGSSGVLSLARQHTHTGFYGAALEISGRPPAQYVVLFKAEIDGVETIAVDYLELGEDEHLYRCVANAMYEEDDDRLTVNAWLVDHSQTVSLPINLAFTLYDDAGVEVFGLTSGQPDANGVFRVVRDAPGIDAGRSYYANVEINDEVANYSSLVGLVVVK